MRGQATIQILLVIVSLVIIFTVIQPRIGEISTVQDENAQYQDSLSKAKLFNDRLQELLAIQRSFSRADLESLERFLPESIDPVAVAADIETIAGENNLVIEEISTGDSGGGSEDDSVVSEVTTVDPEFFDPATGVIETESLDAQASSQLRTTAVTVSALGSYENLKSALRDYERNAYPLRLTSLSFEIQEDSDLLGFEIVLETYAMSSLEEPNQ